jgi:streptogramin lyase
VIVAAAAAILLGKGSPASCPKVSGGSLRLERIDPESLFVRQSIPAPPFATAIAVDHQGVWAATPAGISVTCVAQEQTGGQVDLPFTPSQVAMGYNGLWVAGSMAHGAAGSPGRVTRVVHPTGPVDSPSRVRDTPIAVTLGASAVWVLGSHGTLTRLAKPAGSGSGEPSVPKGVSVGAGASDVVVDEDRPSGPVVWVVNDRTRTLRPVRPHPLHVGKTTPLPGGADAVTVTPGRVWFLDEGRSRLTSVDDTTGEPEGPPITVGNSPTDVAAADQALWVANGGSLWRIDPVTEDVRKRPLDGRVLSLAVEPPIPTRHQAIWVLVRRPTAS